VHLKRLVYSIDKIRYINKNRFTECEHFKRPHWV